MAYIPWGPVLPSPFNIAPLSFGGEHARALEALALKLKIFLPANTVFIRFDLPWTSEEPNADSEAGSAGRLTVCRDMPHYLGKAFRRASADVQPADTVLVDLGPAENEILARMKNKWRYNIGLAEKKGVDVRLSAEGAGPDLESYFKLYKETAARDGISIHGIAYYAALFDEAKKHNVDVRLYLASHEGEDIAGIITLFQNGEAVYLYGASSNHKRNLMAPYALQWRAMRDAKAAGCSYYDLYGIPPHPPEEDPNHPMAGLYRFKTGFGGRIVHRPGCWDFTCRPLMRALYSAAEAARKKVWTIRKLLKRR
jgi:lipid II:glycine glycyltransferase (peptidoglycan interpeptide bridge formation enzyme)